MIEILTIIAAVFVARWYLGVPNERPRYQRRVNLNRDVDEWNAREMVEEEEEI